MRSLVILYQYWWGASEALPTITENIATLLSEAQRQDDDDRDPFADLDDDEEVRNKQTASRGFVDNTGNSRLFFNHMIVVLHYFTTCSSDRNKRCTRLVAALEL